MDEKRTEALEMWIRRKMTGVSWVDRFENEEVLTKICEKMVM